MADSASGSHFQSDVLGLRTSSSFFKLPGFFIGFSLKGSFESDTVKSPTSPLDLSFFSNLSNPFSLKSPRASQSGHKKQWDSYKAGLGLVKLLFDDSQGSEVPKSPKRKNVIFGSQIRFSDSKRSNSLPKNYVISLPSQTGNPKGQLGKSSSVSGEEFVLSEPIALEDSSLSSLTRIPSFGSKACFPANRSTSISSLPAAVVSRSLKKYHSLDIKPSSVPIPILSGQGHVGSLSAQEIELSEDYTCIISYGPTPKTTHIFGDQILERHDSELTNFDQTETSVRFEMPQEAKCPEDGSPCFLSDEFLTFCYSCKKKLQNGDHIYMYRGEKAFCSPDCRSEQIIAEEDGENTDGNSTKNNSPKSSYAEDVF